MKSKHIKWIILYNTFVFLVYMTGCETDHSERELTKLTVGVTASYLGEAATFVAVDKGFFNEQGLDVTLKLNPSGSRSIRELFSAEVDIAHVAETPVVYSVMRGDYHNGEVPDFKIFAEMIYSHHIQKIITRKDSGIEVPHDMKGKRVGVYRGTQLDYFFDSFLLEHQLDHNNLVYINLTPDQQIGEIIDGEIDVAVVWEPAATYIKDKLGDQAIELTTSLTYSTLWMATALSDFATDHPGLLASYLKALQNAQSYILENPEESQEILSRYTEIPLNVVETIWNEVDYQLSLSERMLSLLEDQARWMIQNELADTTRYDMRELIHFESMEEVHPQGITIIR
jgi:ABC-type nitrate/sulfonate/bicarbonate transport system substrate-binding protein